MAVMVFFGFLLGGSVWALKTGPCLDTLLFLLFFWLSVALLGFFRVRGVFVSFSDYSTMRVVIRKRDE